MTDWIRVEDKLPTETGQVQCLCKYLDNEWEETLNAYICPEYGNLTWEWLDHEDFPVLVTHWKPLR